VGAVFAKEAVQWFYENEVLIMHYENFIHKDELHVGITPKDCKFHYLVIHMMPNETEMLAMGSVITGLAEKPMWKPCTLDIEIRNGDGHGNIGTGIPGLLEFMVRMTPVLVKIKIKGADVHVSYSDGFFFNMDVLEAMGYTIEKWLDEFESIQISRVKVCISYPRQRFL
jgi:hypothetical protein